MSKTGSRPFQYRLCQKATTVSSVSSTQLLAVESVIDSSRYFAIRIVDRSSQRHAFIGLGFRDRGHASNFSAAIDDHRSFLRRQKEAERIASERIEAGGNESGGAYGKDLSLKGTLHIDASKLGNGRCQNSASSHSGRIQSCRDKAQPQTCLLPLPSPPMANNPLKTVAGQGLVEPDMSVADDEWGDFQ